MKTTYENTRFFALGVVMISLFATTSPLVAGASVTPCPYMWSKNLKIGMTGADVLNLQRMLNKSVDTSIAPSGAGSLGFETEHFGTLTKSAVIAFQEKYSADILVPNGLKTGTGIVGDSTRAKLNTLCAAAVSVESQPLSQSAVVTLAVQGVDELTVSDPGQPDSSLAPANASPLFLTFALSAGDKDVTIRSITMERAGLGSDAAFGSVGLYGEDGLQIGNIKSFNAEHRVIFNEPFTIPAHTSQTLEVYANMGADLTAQDGQAPFFQIVAISASSPVSGPLPLRGAPQTINATLIVGSATMTLGQFDPGTASNRYINDTNVRFSGVRITADSREDLTFSNIIWRQSGTAGDNDIANVVTVVNGTEYPTSIRKRDYISFFEPGIVIRKGDTIDMYIKGDLTTTGSNRTVKFDIYDNTDDFSLTGNTYGFAVGAVPGGNTATEGGSVFLTDTGDTDGNSLTPYFQGSVTTITGASFGSIGR